MVHVTSEIYYPDKQIKKNNDKRVKNYGQKAEVIMKMKNMK